MTTAIGRPPNPVTPAEESCRRSKCPVCAAAPGLPCRSPHGKRMQIVHLARREEAIRAGHHSP